MRCITKIIAAICLLCALFPSVSSAQLPYDTWFVDRQNGGVSPIQPIYMPKKIIDGNRMDVPFSAPSDIFIAGNGHVYVADTGNNRIVELDGEGEYVRSIGMEEGEGKLNAPEGVFVAEDGTIYAANTGGRTINMYSASGQLRHVFQKPESELLYEDYHFLPTKLAVDRRGVMYIVVKDTYQGLFRMNSKGEFTGFFGANKAKLTWLDRLKRAVLSKEQLAKEAPKRPNAIENVTMMEDVFLLVTSSGTVSDGQIRKLNAGGADAFHNKRFDPGLIDTAVDSQGFLYSISRGFGDVTIFDPTGFQLIFFGAGDSNARQHGVTGFPTSIAVSPANEVWIADSALNLLQVFERTSFGETFLKANELYFQGEYEKSKPYWEEVTRQNGMMDIAFSGLGKNALHERNYAKAVNYFLEARDAKGYSDAFWYVRYVWIQRHFVLALVIAVAVLWGLRLLIRKWRSYAAKREWPPLLRRYAAEIRDAFYVMFHPYEGFYRLKERKISWFVILIILLSALGVNLYSVFGASIIAFPYDIARVNIPLRLGLLIVPWITWVIANYLVSSVKGGEGRFREVVQASAFAIMPYVLMMIPITAISNIIVFEEWIVYDLLTQIMWFWILLLFFVMTQVTHNFDFLETVKNIAITVFTIGVIWIFLTIIIALTVNLYDFIQQIYREVIFIA
ncbi:YIP1 family protein [Paenibacillus thermotolerans]|uniref:YIP1 family protein n=1 Tax=Paenibacillus thermotolerans TaxID=3027807 RepID=UPI0023681AE8|nr:MULTISPECIES: YIP1 family protein [unclassified Paenibacillus]